MSYTVLARRYRSNAFDQVIGQQPIAKTLQNAIATDRVAHAFLFTGTRGVGKTSMARLFARALNAPSTIADCPKATGDILYPPEDIQQRMGQAIMRGDDLNVIEIDGASNNRVDDVRDLIAKASLAPTQDAPYKIYIIDEVHMLSTGAFNALLKTMEEPPSHVKFILCTTETHKVPATIQSRCQRFDFQNIPTQEIAAHLQTVLDQEGITSDEQTNWQIARLGNGSMRDALSLLDRIIAAGENPITPKLLEQMLGLPPRDLIDQLINAIARSEIQKTLEATAALLNQGIALDQLLDVLIEQFRQLLLIGACGVDSPLVELSLEGKEVAVAQAKQFDAPAIVYMIALCENLQRTTKQSANPRALLDASMVRLALSQKMADITELLKDQKKNLNAQQPNHLTAPKTPNQTPPQTPQPMATPPVATASTPITPTPTPPKLSPPPQQQSRQKITQPEHVDPSSEASPFNQDQDPAPAPRSASAAGRGTTHWPQAVTAQGQSIRNNSEAAGGGGVSGQGVPCDMDIPRACPSLLEDQAALGKALRQLISQKPSLNAWLSKLQITALDSREVTLSPLPGQKDIAKFASADRQKAQIAKQLQMLTGKLLRVSISNQIEHAGQSHDSAVGAPRTRAGRHISKADQQAALDLPLVKQLREMFDISFVGLSVDPDSLN